MFWKEVHVVNKTDSVTWQSIIQSFNSSPSLSFFVPLSFSFNFLFYYTRFFSQSPLHFPLSSFSSPSSLCLLFRLFQLLILFIPPYLSLFIALIPSPKTYLLLHHLLLLHLLLLLLLPLYLFVLILSFFLSLSSYLSSSPFHPLILILFLSLPLLISPLLLFSSLPVL